MFLQCAEETQNRSIAGNLNSVIHHPYTTDKTMIITINFHFLLKQQGENMSISKKKQSEDKMKEGS